MIGSSDVVKQVDYLRLPPEITPREIGENRDGMRTTVIDMRSDDGTLTED